MDNSLDRYQDPIIARKRTQYIDITGETHSVRGGRVQLTEIPSKRERVVVKGNNRVWKEVQSIRLEPDYFRVDYVNGVVYFHEDNENKSFSFDYKGTGAYYFPASRIWVKEENGEVTETLDTLTTRAEEQADRAEVGANKAHDMAVYAQELTSDFETMVRETKKDYKQAVNTYSEIVTTYPNPEIGWVVTAIDTGRRYRYDGFEWVFLDVVQFDKLDVFVSPIAPVNVNLVWIRKDVKEPYLTRITKSSTPPEDKRLIWLESIN
ncbi:hypothetical protein SAMN05421503_1414 [Terribacillus aidingensis]|uniref:Uncharacterized protein n=1 Tax=Terribacillus aidingensis TaxID=586416 RepID=A0A285NQK6_9BACI|nr:hypothetical protein [Terribacillus aidingensis]SNZ09911.1 hypothetical protein SAMN05421503_1414 [Terribacillus aidingensis]